MPPGVENQERPPEVQNNNVLTDNTALASLSTINARRDDFSRLLDDLRRNNLDAGRDLTSRGVLPGFNFNNSETQGSNNPVQGRDEKGRPNKLDWNGTQLKVEYDKDGKVSKIVNADNTSKVFLDAQSVKNADVKVDNKTGNISYEGAAGQKIEFNLKEGTKTSTSKDNISRTITDARGHKTTQEGKGDGNFTTTGFTSKDGAEYKVGTDPITGKEFSNVSKPAQEGQPEKKVEGGKLSFDKDGRLNQKIGDRTNIYDKDLNLIESKDKNGKTIEKVGENGVKSLKQDKDGSLVADLGDNKFRSTALDGSRTQHTDTPVKKNDPNSNVKREIQALDEAGKPTGPKYEMTVDKDGNIQGKEVRREQDGKVTKAKVEDGKLVEKQGDLKVTRDAHLNATEVTGKNGEKVAKVGEQGVKGINVDDKGNVVASLGDGKFRATAPDGTRTEYQEKPVPGKPGQVERTFSSPPGLTMTVGKGEGGQEQILEAKKNGETIAKVGQDGVKSIKLDDKNNVVADLGDGKTRISTPEGKKLEYQDKAVEGKPGQFERTYTSPPGYKASVTKDANGKEQITEVKKGDVTIAKAGEKGVTSIQGIDGEGKVTAKLEDGKTFKVIGADGNEAAKFTEKTENGKTVRTFNPPAGVEVTMENGQPTEVKYDTKDRKESWKIGPDGTATRTGGTGDLNKLEKASIDPSTGQVKGEAALKDKNNQPEKVQLALNPDGSRTETRTAKDKAGTSYEYKTTKDKNGLPIEVQHPSLKKDGTVVPGSMDTTKYEYEKDGSGNVVTKDGKPQLKKVEFQSLAPNGDEKTLALIKQGDGKWALKEKVRAPGTLAERWDDPTVGGKKQAVPHWAANAQVESDGTLKMRDADGSFTKIGPSGEVNKRPPEDFSKGPQNEAEKEAAKKRSEIVQVGTQADGKKTWGQGVPTVDTQWGFGNWGVEKGSFGPQTHMGDQGYTFSISQQVGKDAQGNDVIQRRETTFNTEKGVAIYYRDAEGNMKALHNVTSMVSERQQDGSYKITYNVKGQNPGDANAPKPVTLNTTRDGRYVDQDGMAIGGRTDAPTQPPRQQYRASNGADDPQKNVKATEEAIRKIDTSTEAGKRQADQLAQQLIQQQSRVEDQRIAQAAEKNDRLGQLEAERRKADLEFQAQSEKERQALVEKIKKGQSIDKPEPKVTARPEAPVRPRQPYPVIPNDPTILPFRPNVGPDCPGGT